MIWTNKQTAPGWRNHLHPVWIFSMTNSDFTPEKTFVVPPLHKYYMEVGIWLLDNNRKCCHQQQARVYQKRSILLALDRERHSFKYIGQGLLRNKILTTSVWTCHTVFSQEKKKEFSKLKDSWGTANCMCKLIWMHPLVSDLELDAPLLSVYNIHFRHVINLISWTHN